MGSEQNDEPTSAFRSRDEAGTSGGEAQAAAGKSPAAEAGFSDPSPSGSGGNRAASNLTGCLKGDYQILRRIGRGGMADVYVAQQKSLDRQVAIKVLRSDLATDANYVERFRREAKSVARLSHPCIVQVYEVGQWDGQHYIVQEFVDGRNLRQELDANGPLTVETAVAVLAGVTEALDVAYEAGITHRDIKPENIMLCSSGKRRDGARSAEGSGADADAATPPEGGEASAGSGRGYSYGVKVADFGLARLAQQEGTSNLTQVGLTMGTPRYMSPEQLQGKPVGIQSDLYSLGVSMFHLLTGRPPFEAEDPLAMAVKHLHEAPPSLVAARAREDLPPWLVRIVERLLEKSPEHRFRDPHELREAIRRGIANESPTLVGRASGHQISAEWALQRAMQRQSKQWSKRTVAVAAAWLLPALGLVAGGALIARQPRTDVADLLAEGETSVEKQATVEAQYLEAARRDQPHAWRAVWEYFPPEASNLQREYAVKARLQLARFFAGNRQPDEARRILETLLADAELDKLYRALTLVQMISLLDQNQRKQEAAEYRNTLIQLYQDLERRFPDKRALFEQIAPRSEVERLQAN